MLEFCVLGPLVVTAANGAIEPTRPLERSVLAFLVVHAGQVVPTDRLLDELWSERLPEPARHSLHVHVCRLRRVLGDHVLLTRHPGYLLSVGDEQVDARRFESRVREGRRMLRDGQTEDAVRLLDEALSLWRGSPLPELADLPLGRVHISRLEELRLGALEDFFEAKLAVGHVVEVVETLTGLARENPFRERLWGHLMVALYRSGRQADALLAFRELKGLLGEELGIEPGRDLQNLKEAIILHKPELG